MSITKHALQQLSLFADETAATLAVERQLQFVCGVPCRKGATYVHIIRDDNDPERPPRDGQTLRWRNIDRRSPEEWRARIVELLEDRQPRTFNAIMLELAGFTADVAAGTHADDGLWLAVERHQLVLTLEAPVFFTLHPRPHETTVCSRRVD